MEINHQLADLRDKDYEELIKLFSDIGEKPYRAGQLYRWLHHNLSEDFEELLNLPLSLRERLQKDYYISLPSVHTMLCSKLDDTRKFIFKLRDAHLIESVYMKYKAGSSVCVSSQLGCKMGCKFCASTVLGVVRNLTSGEMLSQVYRIQKLINERISHVVVMGTGEPFENYNELLQFIKMLTDKRGLSLSKRNITVSTCGIVPGILAFSKDAPASTLALSLHAPTDALRKQIMPVANRYSLKEIFKALSEYFSRTGRRITFEYALLKGINASASNARDLVKLIRTRADFPCHVNLIPVNPISERNFQAPGTKMVNNFREIIEEAGIPLTIRRTLGQDIGGSCGQLRRDALISGGTLI